MTAPYPTAAAWEAAAQRLGVGVAEVKAVMRVEAAGRFFESDGMAPRRFEPHHVPRPHWSDIGFAPKGRAPWRASLRLDALTRREMANFTAHKLGPETALQATSMGAPQIMGFNHALCGFQSAGAMWSSFCQSADHQLAAFTSFLIASDLDGPLRAHDWRVFAARYNGPANVDVYAPRLEAAFERETRGARSPEILRLGERGDGVERLQAALANAGVFDGVIDGAFGPATLRAVRTFQDSAGLKVDGVVGFQTWRALVGDTKTAPALQPNVREADNAERVETAKTLLPALLGGGGVTSAVAVVGDLDGASQVVLVSAVAVAGLGALTIWAAPMIRRAFRGASRGAA